MLMVALMAVAVMTVQGSVALTTALNNITTSTVNRTVGDGQVLVEAGLAEARSRLKGVSSVNNMIADPFALLGLANPLWSAFLISVPSWTSAKDPEYNAGGLTYTNYIPSTTSLTSTTVTANGLQTALQYWVKLRHKKEYDAEVDGHRTTSTHYTDSDGITALHSTASPGSIIWYGYTGGTTGGVPIEFTTADTTPGWVGLNPTGLYPVELLKAYATVNNTTKTTQAYMVHELPMVPGALYAKGNVVFPVEANAATVDGVDNCGVSPAAASVPHIYTMGASITGGYTANGPAAVTNGTVNIDIAGAISKLKANSPSVTTLTSDPGGSNTYGNPLFNNWVTVYANTSSPPNVNGLELRDDTGYGLLLVDGDLILDDDTTWYGVIYVSGTLTLDANGANETRVRGAIYANSVAITHKSMDIQYDVCSIAKAMARQPLKIIRWKVIS